MSMFSRGKKPVPNDLTSCIGAGIEGDDADRHRPQRNPVAAVQSRLMAAKSGGGSHASAAHEWEKFWK